MKKNFNKSGRFIRFILGSAFTIIALTDLLEDEFLENIILGIGIVLLLTAIINFCPLYYFLGIDTSKSNNKMKMY